MGLAKLTLLLVVLTLFAVACAGAGSETSKVAPPVNSPATSAPSATPDELASARIHFQKNCVECHGEKGEGGRKEVDGKRFKVPNLGAGHPLEHSDEKLVLQINEGDEEMPAFKDKLTPAEISELVRFIRKEFQGK
jgi:mono/diheme cytochrome c family protein